MMPPERKGRGRGGKNTVIKIKPPQGKGFSPNPGCEAPVMQAEGTPGKAKKTGVDIPEDHTSPDQKVNSDQKMNSDDHEVNPVQTGLIQANDVDHGQGWDTEENNNETVGDGPVEEAMTFHKNESGTYECDVCTFTSPYYSGIMSHALIHDGDSPYTCKVCGFRTERRGLMVIHMRMHKGFKPHQCHLCDYSTLQEMHLKVHLRTHGQGRPFKCPGCSYRCASNEILQAHAAKYAHHTRIFRCDVCDYTTMRKHNLIQHTSIHTGAKPFKCDLCPYSSSQKGHLNVHIRTHTREKPFKCNYCPFASTVPKSLREHLQMHVGKRPLQCPYCSFSSSQAFSIKRHISLHEEVTRFDCDLCDYTTRVEEDYAVHRQIHAQDRSNHRCPKCPYESPFRHVFREHLRTQHKGSKRCHKAEAKLDCPTLTPRRRRQDQMTLFIEFDEYKRNHPAEAGMDHYGTVGGITNGDVYKFEDDGPDIVMRAGDDSSDSDDDDVAPFRVSDSMVWMEDGAHESHDVDPSLQEYEVVKKKARKTEQEGLPIKQNRPRSPKQDKAKSSPKQGKPEKARSPKQQQKAKSSPLRQKGPGVLRQGEEPKSPKQKVPTANRDHITATFTCKYCDRKLVGQELWRHHTARHFMEWPEITS